MSSNINSETGESTASRSPRFSMWVALTVFSVIVMGSSIQLKNDQDHPNSDAKWAVACSVLSTIISALITTAHFAPVITTIFLNNIIEGALTFVLAVGWAATVAVVTNTDDDKALLSGGAVSNANLYYFSWACFVTSVVLFVNFARAAFGLDLVDELSSRGARMNHWAALIATSLIVAGSSGRTLSTGCKHLKNQAAAESLEYCKRTKLGIWIGTLGIFLCVGVIVMKVALLVAPLQVEIAIALLLTVLYAFGVGFITSSHGPGSAIGNLYYFSWISFLLSGYLVAAALGAASSPPPTNENTNNNNNQKNDGHGDLRVETLNDEL